MLPCLILPIPPSPPTPPREKPPCSFGFGFTVRGVFSRLVTGVELADWPRVSRVAVAACMDCSADLSNMYWPGRSIRGKKV